MELRGEAKARERNLGDVLMSFKAGDEKESAAGQRAALGQTLGHSTV